MRLFFIVILGVMIAAGRGWAQEDNFTTATSALQDVLSSLKQSVAKLVVDNNQLSAKDNAVKSQVSQLQMRLGQLEAQGESLNKVTGRLQDKNPGRAQEVTRMEEENFDRVVRPELMVKPSPYLRKDFASCGSLDGFASEKVSEKKSY